MNTEKNECEGETYITCSECGAIKDVKYAPKEAEPCPECAGLGLPPVFPGAERRRCNTCGATDKKPKETDR